MSKRMPIILLSGLVLALDTAMADVPSGYRQVAQRTGVPASILYAIALAESGTRLASGKRRPWPWTLNIEGHGYYYRTRLAAWRTLRATLARGVTRVDIGLMQVNWGYHHEALGDAWQALDPYHNLSVGATILQTQHRIAGHWWRAVGRYHAPNHPERAERYRSRVADWHGRVTGAGEPG